MGGTAMPSPQEQTAMQQPMPMSPPMEQPMVSPEQIGEQLARVEADAGAQGVGIGQELAKRMLEGLDSAETPKDIMDSIRGDDKSVEERRTELAEFVGDEDANQTPDTVLAMVQPTIMLTERGAMDSGVGELMEGVADIDMETIEGEPTDVGGGVASLMGVGQQPIQNFRYGGIVQKFQDGTEANLENFRANSAEFMNSISPNNPPQSLAATYGSSPQEFYQQNIPFFESLFDTQQQKQTAKANLLFDIAKTAAAIGTGVNPLTGQRQKMDVVETLSSGLGAVADPLKQYGQAVQQAEQQPKMMAAQEALKQSTEARERKQQDAIQERQNLFEFARQIQGQTYDKSKTESAQKHQLALMREQEIIDENLMRIDNRLKTAKDENLERLKSNLLETRMKLQGKIDENKAVADAEREKDKLGLIQGYEIARLEKQGDIQAALQKDNQIFTSEQNKLNREFENKKLEIEQALKNRGLDLQELGLDIDKAYKEGTLENAIRGLDIDENYKNGLLDIEQRKFKLEELKYDNEQKLFEALDLNTANYSSDQLTSNKEYAERFKDLDPNDAFGAFDTGLKGMHKILSAIGPKNTIITNWGKKQSASSNAVQGLNNDLIKMLQDLESSKRITNQQYEALIEGLPRPGIVGEDNAASVTKALIDKLKSRQETLGNQLKAAKIDAITDKKKMGNYAQVLGQYQRLNNFIGMYTTLYHSLDPRQVPTTSEQPIGNNEVNEATDSLSPFYN